MKKRGKKQGSRSAGRKTLSLIAAGLCVYFSVSILSCQISIYREKQRLHALQQQLEEQKLENDDLRRVFISSDGTEYIERLAREKLGYAAIDERVFVDISGS